MKKTNVRGQSFAVLLAVVSLGLVPSACSKPNAQIPPAPTSTVSAPPAADDTAGGRSMSPGNGTRTASVYVPAGEGFTDFAHIEEEYLRTLKSLSFPDGVTLPDKMENEATDGSFQIGYGNTVASNFWENAWIREWLDHYSSSPEKAARALRELETAFEMPYMGKDRCDDATRATLRDALDQAKLGDPSGLQRMAERNR